MKFFKIATILFLQTIALTSLANNSPPDCLDNERGRWNNCIATLLFPDGTKFRGLITNDKKNGFGEEVYSNGDRYFGTYVDDIPNGYGVHILANGARYAGEIKAGKYEGRGLMLDPQGKIENDGTWSNDKFIKKQPTGIDPKTDYSIQLEKLKFILARKDSILNELEPLMPCKGEEPQYWNRCFIKADQTAWPKYEGESDHGGLKHGKGTFYVANGDIAVGTFNKDKLVIGSYFSRSGSKYVGSFKDGTFSGPGIFFNAEDSTVKEGIWDKGELLNSGPTGIDINIQRPENLKDFYGKKINYEHAVWLFENIAYIGEASKPGRELSKLLNKINEQHFAITVHRSNVNAGLAKKDIKMIAKYQDQEIRTMMEQRKNIDKFVSDWNKTPLSFRSSFLIHEKGVLYPDILNLTDRPNITVIVGMKGQILMIHGKNFETSRLEPITLYPHK